MKISPLSFAAAMALTCAAVCGAAAQGGNGFYAVVIWSKFHPGYAELARDVEVAIDGKRSRASFSLWEIWNPRKYRTSEDYKAARVLVPNAAAKHTVVFGITVGKSDRFTATAYSDGRGGVSWRVASSNPRCAGEAPLIAVSAETADPERDSPNGLIDGKIDGLPVYTIMLAVQEVSRCPYAAGYRSAGR